MAEARARGLRAYAPARRRAWRARPAWILSGVAAALVLGLALVVSPPPVGPPDDGGLVRGDEVQLLAPAGAVAEPPLFRWSSPFRAARYRLTVSGPGGGVVFSTEVEGESAAPSAALREALRPGLEYAWQIEALDAQGEVIVRSRPQPFTLAPAP